MDTYDRVKAVMATIESGALGEGHKVREEVITETVSHLHVTRYGRQRRGYIRIDDGEVDVEQLNIAGMSDRTVLEVLS